MPIPESTEVIDHSAKSLVDLYHKAKTRRGKRLRPLLASEMLFLAQDPEKAQRVSFVLGERMITTLRSRVDLSKPETGIFLSRFDNTEPLDSEVAVSLFLNHVLRKRHDEAHLVIQEIVACGDETELLTFLSLLIAVSAV